MYAHSRLLLRQGFPGTVTEIDTAAGNAVTRSRSAAQHQRQARQALESTDRDADREIEMVGIVLSACSVQMVRCSTSCGIGAYW
jgi:hypothetical protein